MTDTYIDEEESLIGCRRRRSDRRKDFSITHTEEEEDRPRYKMAPKSFEHQIYITSMNVGHRCAYLCRGLVSCFVSRLDGISNFCAIYSFTGILFTLYVGLMIKHQPLFIKGISEENQELTKESAFGAMGMFIFLFTSSVLYLCFNKNRNSEESLRSQGYMRPGSSLSRGGMRMSDYQVSMELSVSRQNSHDDDEMEPILLS